MGPTVHWWRPGRPPWTEWLPEKPRSGLYAYDETRGKWHFSNRFLIIFCKTRVRTATSTKRQVMSSSANWLTTPWRTLRKNAPSVANWISTFAMQPQCFRIFYPNTRKWSAKDKKSPAMELRENGSICEIKNIVPECWSHYPREAETRTSPDNAIQQTVDHAHDVAIKSQTPTHATKRLLPLQGSTLRSDRRKTWDYYHQTRV